MSRIVLAFLIVLVAATADAACLKCDQSTGWWCFMSTFGTKAYCDSPSNAGCFTWGSCNPGECDENSCVEHIAAIRFNDRMRIASVSVVVPLRSS